MELTFIDEGVNIIIMEIPKSYESRFRQSSLSPKPQPNLHPRFF